ncbi:hypothetical protein E3_0230 [Rhodococcus phage E3]|uniref:HicB-like antitoxin n=1 Tax=Rhodococcus phage E3 TaxID=1007869 RepID=UPI0002C6C5EE|nr:HicB-like antitoxin [Rhodococcus phage E3]AEQ20934.1 hypothetical protein E3_0230 [Rhodococcus phage E3]
MKYEVQVHLSNGVWWVSVTGPGGPLVGARNLVDVEDVARTIIKASNPTLPREAAVLDVKIGVGDEIGMHKVIAKLNDDRAAAKALKDDVHERSVRLVRTLRDSGAGHHDISMMLNIPAGQVTALLREGEKA